MADPSFRNGIHPFHTPAMERLAEELTLYLGKRVTTKMILPELTRPGTGSTRGRTDTQVFNALTETNPDPDLQAIQALAMPAMEPFLDHPAGHPRTVAQKAYQQGSQGQHQTSPQGHQNTVPGPDDPMTMLNELATSIYRYTGGRSITTDMILPLNGGSIDAQVYSLLTTPAENSRQSNIQILLPSTMMGFIQHPDPTVAKAAQIYHERGIQEQLTRGLITSNLQSDLDTEKPEQQAQSALAKAQATGGQQTQLTQVYAKSPQTG